MNYNQFQRTELLLGTKGLNRLRQSTVAVIGCGAVGSFAVEALARAGIGTLILIDGDEVQETNINRQLCALHSTLGQKKVAVLAKRIQDICPKTRVTAISEFATIKNFEASRIGFINNKNATYRTAADYSKTLGTAVSKSMIKNAKDIGDCSFHI